MEVHDITLIQTVIGRVMTVVVALAFVVVGASVFLPNRSRTSLVGGHLPASEAAQPAPLRSSRSVDPLCNTLAATAGVPTGATIGW
jgi:hypothetical protein